MMRPACDTFVLMVALRRFRYALVIFLAAPMVGVSQSSFTERFGGPLAHDGVGLVPYGNGWSVITRAYDGASEGHGILLMHRSASGGPVGENAIALDGRAFAQAAAAVANGGSFVCGSSLLPGGSHRAALARTNEQGQTLWTWSLPDTATTQFLGVAAMPDGGAVACGIAKVDNANAVLVARFGSSGDLLWQRTQPFPLDAEAHAVAVQPTAIMVTGRQANFGGTSDALFLAYDLDGDLLMSTSWGGIADEEGRALVATSDGHFVMAGSTRSYGPMDGQGRRRSNLHLIKIDLNGDTLWTRTHGDILLDRVAFAMDQAANGDLLVAGRSGGIGAGNNLRDGLVVRVDASGDLLWERTYDTARSEGLHAIRVLADGFVAAGSSFGPDGRRAVLLRRNAQGE